MNISLKGISTPGGNENRTLAHLSIEYNSITYDWQLFIPTNITNLYQFLEDSKPLLIQQIELKEQEWNNLEPKTKIIIDNDTGENITVPIEKHEIVKPDIPDNYAKRRNEYPPIIEQLGALWKGPSSKDYEDIMNSIQEIKNKYPIDSNATVPLVVSPLQAKAALLQAGLLLTVENTIANADPLIQLAWAEAQEFRRYSQSILTIAQLLNLSEQQLDDLFVAAYNINL